MSKNDNLNFRINNQIKAKTVRIVGDEIESRVCSIEEALQEADDLDLDLVEISPNTNPPVVKVIDYKKFLYLQKKKKKDQEKNQTQVKTKEIRYTPMTDEHDYNFKLNHAKKFLNEGNRIKTFVFFKGRMITHKELGTKLLTKLIQDLNGLGEPEGSPKMEGNKMLLFFKSIKINK